MPSKGTFSLKVLIDAVRRRVDETSLRDVAEELGMSSSGLHVLLNGSRPHPGTRDKLVSWYLERQRQETSSRKHVSGDDADAAIRILVHYVKQDAREDARVRRVREIVARLEEETK